MTKYLIALCSVIALISGCATPGGSLQNTHDTNNAKLVWPPPPHTPKIEFVLSISNSHDIGAEKTWLRKTMDAITGKEETEEYMIRPYGVCLFLEKLYVTDPGLSVVHVFDFQEKRYHQIEEAGANRFISPVGITANTNGNIFVTDSILKKVFIFDGQGKYLREIGSNDIFERPTGIAVGEDKIYVVDTHAHQVLVFSAQDGQLLFRFGRNGIMDSEFHYPTHIFIDNNSQLYVTDSLNFRVQIFDCDGNFLSSFGKFGDAIGDFSKPKGIAVDSDGNIYVADSQLDNVQIFDRFGRLLLVFGGSGSQPGRMSLPAGIFIDRNDRLYVADSYNRRIQVFQYLGKRPKKLD